MISEIVPPNNTAPHVVACYLEHDGKFLLLKRNPNKPHGNTWGLPAGKVDAYETVLEAIVREVREETGYNASPAEIKSLPSLWVESNGNNFNYHSFLLTLNNAPTITLSEKEHQEYTWVTPKESLEMDLIHDLDACNQLFFNKTSSQL